MLVPRSGLFWVLVLLGTAHAMLAASILFESSGVWWWCGAGYLAWLVWVNWHYEERAARLIGLGYLAPLALFAGWYAWGAMAPRPETAQAMDLVRPGPRLRASAPGADVPSPKLAPAGGDRGLVRGTWALSSTFLYLAACAMWGLFTGTPVLVWAVAVVAVVITSWLKEDPY